MREVAMVVQEKNDSEVPVYSSLYEHYNFYFRNSGYAVHNTENADLSHVNKFWLLQADFFLPEEKDQELAKYLDTFEVAEVYPFYKTAAVLLIRKEPDQNSR
jgi:hypothetical protein